MPNALNWQKSTYSGGGDGDNCVELAVTTTAIHLRESAAPATALTTGAPQLHALLTALKDGHVTPTRRSR